MLVTACQPFLATLSAPCTALLAACTAPFAAPPRSTEPPTLMAHRWDSGWVPIALAALRQDSQSLSP